LVTRTLSPKRGGGKEGGHWPTDPAVLGGKTRKIVISGEPMKKTVLSNDNENESQRECEKVYRKCAGTLARRKIQSSKRGGLIRRLKKAMMGAWAAIDDGNLNEEMGTQGLTEGNRFRRGDKKQLLRGGGAGTGKEGRPSHLKTKDKSEGGHVIKCNPSPGFGGEFTWLFCTPARGAPPSESAQ